MTPQPTSTPENNLLKQALEKHRKSTNLAQQKHKSSPHIFIVGKTGTGKSRSIKNLDPAKTLVINVESKILPFENAKDFEENSISGFTFSNQVDCLLKDIKDLPDIKYIVFDSFTKYAELSMAENRQMGGGWEIMNRYYKQIFDLFEGVKKVTNKIFIFLANDEIVKVEQPSGATVGNRHISCDGKWLTKIEKEFAVVLFTDVKVTMENGKPKHSYKFITQTDGVTSAKSPEGMFSYEIDNDLKIVVERVEKYFGLV